MPVFFIHGVNNREGAEYNIDCAARTRLLQDMVLTPLASKGERFQKLAVCNIYWGKDGVSFGWEMQTMPDVGFIRSLGPNVKATAAADDAIRITLDQIAQERARANPGAGFAPPLNEAADALKLAAMTDPERFLEAALSPMILSEMRPKVSAGDSDEAVGTREALILQAAAQVAAHPDLVAQLEAAPDDDAVLDLLRERIEAELGRMEQESESRARGESAPGIAPMGGLLRGTGRFLGEVFGRVKGAPARAVSTAALDLWRDRVHNHASLFFGDVFVYLKERGTAQNPGPIINDVLSAIKGAKLNHPEEPTIVLTHSMGGNIFYDVLTYYEPTLRVDFWASVGGQVGQFEEMKLFCASDKAVRAPNKVSIAGWKNRVKYWLNVYDPVDPFSFKVAPALSLPLLSSALVR